MASLTTQTEIDKYSHQAERLGQLFTGEEDTATGSTRAIEARFITPQDPVIQIANGGRLPVVPVNEAVKLNLLKNELEGRPADHNIPLRVNHQSPQDDTTRGEHPDDVTNLDATKEPEPSLASALPADSTNPLFPPLPLYGPPSLMRSIHCRFFRCTSAVLSLIFLIVVLAGAIVTSIPSGLDHIRLRLLLRDPRASRPFHDEELRRAAARKQAAKAWRDGDKSSNDDRYVPTEGGPDRLTADPAYYARRVGLDAEVFDLETEDGFIITLLHLYNPIERRSDKQVPRRHPILMIHGLFQSAGAYCCTDDNSLAFFLAKSGYDVWLGNNRCGFSPRHTLLTYGDPRMWAWNIRQMGVMDLSALTDRVLHETGFSRLALIAHSQGTTQTLVALAKDQRPALGEKLSVFCALAPAAYAGPLISHACLKFMAAINPAAFKLIFGIHAFIPLMNFMHTHLNRRVYGAIGYRVFAFLFGWTDTRWDRGLRDRLFQFSPTYASAESMRWWLGRECFAKQKCILATREDVLREEALDAMHEQRHLQTQNQQDQQHRADSRLQVARDLSPAKDRCDRAEDEDRSASAAWYDARFPPLAMWVAGADGIVDGRRLLRRFATGREPSVQVVHEKVVEGYEHLDVIWAVDAIEQVGVEVRRVVWATAFETQGCEIPLGCEAVERIEDWRDRRTELHGQDDVVGVDVDEKVAGNDRDEEQSEEKAAPEAWQETHDHGDVLMW